jgi:hypothetical protein
MNVSGLPFSQRTTSAVAVFASIFIASPAEAQALPATPQQRNSLAFSYGQLTNLYPFLISQDVSNTYQPLVESPQTQLLAYITQGVNLIQQLVTTLNSMSATTPSHSILLYSPYNLKLPDIALILSNYRIVAQNALVQITAAQNAPPDYE